MGVIGWNLRKMVVMCHGCCTFDVLVGQTAYIAERAMSLIRAWGQYTPLAQPTAGFTPPLCMFLTEKLPGWVHAKLLGSWGAWFGPVVERVPRHGLPSILVHAVPVRMPDQRSLLEPAEELSVKGPFAVLESGRNTMDGWLHSRAVSHPLAPAPTIQQPPTSPPQSNVRGTVQMPPTYAMNGPLNTTISHNPRLVPSQCQSGGASRGHLSPRSSLPPTAKDLVGGLKTQLRRLLVAWDSQLLGPWLSHRHGRRDESERRGAGFSLFGTAAL